jgi:AcrR family transcriptional regulator
MNEELKNILNKVRFLFMKYGIKSVTMDDVARELGISKKTLYQYVENKNDLLAKIFDMEIADSDCYIEGIDRSKINAIEELFIIHKFLNKILNEYSPSSLYDLKKYYPEFYNKMTLVRREKIYTRIIRNLKKGIEEGLYLDDINTELIAKIQVERTEKTMDNDYLTLDEISTPEIFLEIFKYHIRGIATPKGIKELEKEIEKLKTNNN